jgi:hypothetical protein
MIFTDMQSIDDIPINLIHVSQIEQECLHGSENLCHIIRVTFSDGRKADYRYLSCRQRDIMFDKLRTY